MRLRKPPHIGYINNKGVCMNKHHGGSVKEYLKEKGIYEEIIKMAEERWKELMIYNVNKRYTFEEFRDMFYKQYPDGTSSQLLYLWNTYKMKNGAK